jgi:hypothetical protein
VRFIVVENPLKNAAADETPGQILSVHSAEAVDGRPRLEGSCLQLRARFIKCEMSEYHHNSSGEVADRHSQAAAFMTIFERARRQQLL